MKINPILSHITAVCKVCWLKKEVKVVRIGPRELKNNVILPTRWFQISFNSIFSVFPFEELPFGI